MNKTQIKNFLKGMNDNQNLGMTQSKNVAYLRGYDTFGYYRLIHDRKVFAARRAAA
jgi:hypothetical protein